MIDSLLRERDEQKRRADEQQQRTNELQVKNQELQVENLRLQLELERYKKWYYGPRADRLRSSGEMAQMLLEFAEALERKPVNPADVSSQAEAGEQLRRVERRKGRRALADFENLLVTTHVYELSTEERVCPGCGVERKEVGAEESWQIEYIPGRFERIQHVRKKYACPSCDSNGKNPRMETAPKPDAAIDKGMAGPGLLAYIVTSKSTTIFHCTGWKTFLCGKASRSRERRNRSGAGMWPIWPSRYTI